MARRAASTRSVLENENGIRTRVLSSRKSQNLKVVQKPENRVRFCSHKSCSCALHPLQRRCTWRRDRHIKVSNLYFSNFLFWIFSVFNHVPPLWRSAAYWLLGEEREDWAQFKLSCSSSSSIQAPSSADAPAATLAGQGGKAQLKSSKPRTSPALTIDESWDSQFEFELTKGFVVSCLQLVTGAFKEWVSGEGSRSLPRWKPSWRSQPEPRPNHRLERLSNPIQKSNTKTSMISFQKLRVALLDNMVKKVTLSPFDSPPFNG